MDNLGGTWGGANFIWQGGGASHPTPLRRGGGFWGGVGWHTLALCILNCCLVLFNCFDVYKGQGAAHHIIWPTLPPLLSCAILFFLQPHDTCLVLLR